jgi:hypothetical protein
MASYEDLAPLYWDAEEWDYSTWSEDDEPLTDDGFWMKTTTTPGMATSFLPRKKIPRLFLRTVI